MKTIAFEQRKAIPKAEVLKLKPGTFIRLKWLDASDEIALLLEKPEREKGDVSLKCFYPHRSTTDSHAVHSQVMENLGSLKVPSY